jgi:TPR repeat protein
MSVADIGALVERGDALFSARDISSARLYYERAAEAGDGRAALQLGTSFDPVILERAGVHVAGDLAQALSWYRRARELGMTEAELRIKSLERWPVGETDNRSR